MALQHIFEDVFLSQYAILVAVESKSIMKGVLGVSVLATSKVMLSTAQDGPETHREVSRGNDWQHGNQRSADGTFSMPRHQHGLRPTW